MRTGGLRNPYFQGGWADWQIALSDAAGRFHTDSDGLRCGLMSGLPNAVGFPLVGDNYMLLAREAESSNDAAAASTVVLETVNDYTLDSGDVLAVDVGFVLTQKDGGTVLDELGTTLRLQFGGSGSFLTRWYHIAANAAVNQPCRFTLAHTNDYSTARTYPVKLTLSFDDLASGTGSQIFAWISADNFRIYSAVDNIAYDDAYDASGVS